MPHWIYDKWTDSIIIDPIGTTIDIPLDKDAPFSEPWLYPTIEFFLINRYLRER